MNHQFWFSRWQEGRIGFHEGAPNGFLTRHGDWLDPCRRVLVPLCGKSYDLAYLAGRGHQVVGVELVEAAVQQFFAEHDITPTITKHDNAVVYSAGAIAIVAADWFAMTPSLVGHVDGIYDRAALIALPPDMRARYVAHLRSLAPTSQRELLITVEYPPGSAEGPPFSVEEAEVRSHFPGAQVDVLAHAPDTRGRAGVKMVERCYAIALV